MSVSAAGAPRRIGGPRQQSVLAVLLLNANSQVTTSNLVDAVWSENPPATADATIRSYVSHLRRALRDPGRADHLRSRSNVHTLTCTPDELDCLRFEQLADGARRAAAAGDLPAALAFDHAAIGIWRGDPLTGIDHTPLISSSVSRLEALRLSTLEHRIDMWLALGQHESAIAGLQELIAAHPLHERLRAQLMTALYRAGRQADALAVYQDARRTLVEELGLQPGPELRRMEQAVLAQSADLDLRVAEPVPNAEPEPVRTPARLVRTSSVQLVGTSPAGPGVGLSGEVVGTSSAEPGVGLSGEVVGTTGEVVGTSSAGPGHLGRFVGRAPEVRRLRRALDEAATDRGGQVVTIGAAPGMGKTRLVQESLVGAADRGIEVLWSWCYEGSGAPPFWLWRQVVAACLEAYGLDLLDTLTSGEQAALAHLLPDRPTGPRADTARPQSQSQSPSGLRPPPDVASRAVREPALTSPSPSDARFVLFQAVTTLLSQASARRPLVVVLDDLHWADSSSLLLLELFAKQLAALRVMVAATYRVTELSPRHPVTALLGELSRERHTTRMSLPGLSVEEVAEYLDSVGAAGCDLAATLHAKTDGNPFFVTELLRPPVVGGHPVRAEQLTSAELDIPDTVRDMVLRRCQRLSPSAHDLLILAAVIGREFELRVLEAARPGGGPVDDDLDQALAAGLISEVPGAEGTYRFTHQLINEALYGESTWLRRTRDHRAVAEALEQVLGGNPGPRVIELAQHFAPAARRSDGLVPKALRYLVEAARWSNGAFAYEEAVRHWERGLELVRAIRPHDRRSRLDLLIGLGDSLFRAGEVARAQETFLSARADARALGDPVLLSRVALGYAGRLVRNWHTVAGALSEPLVELLHEALDQLEQRDSAELVAVLGLLAEDMSPRLSLTERESISGEAVAVARRLGDRETLVGALCSRALALWHPAYLDDRAALVEELAGLAAGDREIALFVGHHRFVLALERGDAADTERAYRCFRALTEKAQQPVFRWQAEWFAAMRAMVGTDLEQAERLVAAATESGMRCGDPDAAAIAAAQWSFLRLEQGRIGELAGAVEQLVDQDRAHWLPAWVVVTAETGRSGLARAGLDELVSSEFAAIQEDFLWLGAMAMLGETAAALGHRPAVELLHRRLSPYADRIAMSNDTMCWGSMHRYLGVMLRSLGDTAGAETHLRTALSRNTAIGAEVWAAHTRCDLAALLLERADPQSEVEARSLLDVVLAERPAAGTTRAWTRAEHLARKVVGA